MNEGIGMQLLFHFIVFVNMVASSVIMNFFICGSGFKLKFSRIALSLKCSPLDFKTNFTTTGLIFEFFVEYASFR